MTDRRPTPAEMGDEVTIAIVAVTQPLGHFVSVTDRMVSYDDILPAEENAVVKDVRLSRNWSVAFAADDVDDALALVHKIRDPIWPNDLEVAQLKQHFATCIFDTLQIDFFNRHLGRYGYKSVEHFRKEGYSELGQHYFDLCRELDKADIGASFIVYGYDVHHIPHLFEIDGQGRITDHRMAVPYAVIGTGYSIASASLKLKPMPWDFDSVVYRLLQAKFSAETATGVGKPTTVMFKRPDEHDFLMWPQDIEKVRAIWLEQMRQREPSGAVDVISNIRMAMLRDDDAKRQYRERQGSTAS
jgi:hypothetical protein